MQTSTARSVAIAVLVSIATGCGDSSPDALEASAGGEAVAASPIDAEDTVRTAIGRPDAAGPPIAEGAGVFQALSSRAIRTVHVVPGTHLAFVENFDDTTSLLDLESGAIRATRRLAFEGEVESRLIIDESGAFAAVAVMPLPDTVGATGPIYLWDLARDHTRIARRAGEPGFGGTAIGIVPGGTEIALVEQVTTFGRTSDGRPWPNVRVTRIDPFRGTETSISFVQQSVSDEVAYSGPRRRALVTSHRESGDDAARFASRVIDGERVVATAEALGAKTLVRPTGGQMLVRTEAAWEARSPSDGSVLATLPVPSTAALAYSSTGECIVAHVDEATFVFIDPTTALRVAELGAQEVLGVDAIGRCEHAVTLGHDRSLLVIDLHENGAEPRRIDPASFAWTSPVEGSAARFVGLASTDDGRFSVSWDGESILIYDVREGHATGLRTFGYSPSIWSVAWSARGDAILAQTRESSFVIDGTDASATDMECALGYSVQASGNGAFVVEEGRAPRCVLRSTLRIPEEATAIRYTNAGDAVAVMNGNDVELIRNGAPKRRITTLRDLRCTSADTCVVRGVFSRDDKRLALLGQGIVLIVDVAQGRTLARHFISSTPHALAFSRNSEEVFAISDGKLERLSVRVGTPVQTIQLPSLSAVPESAETNSYVKVEERVLHIVSLDGGASHELTLEGDEVWDSITPVTQTDPFLFRANASTSTFLVDARALRSYPIRGELLGARHEGTEVVVARCEDSEIRVERLGGEGAAPAVISLGDCTGVRQVALAPDGQTVAIVRGAEIELRRLDGVGGAAIVTLLETEDTGFVLANGGGSFYGTTPSLAHIRYRAPGDARTAAMSDALGRTGLDANLLDRYFGRAPRAQQPAAAAPAPTPAPAPAPAPATLP